VSGLLAKEGTILFIDDAPIHSDLLTYFAGFGYQLVQVCSEEPIDISIDINKPQGIVINWTNCEEPEKLCRYLFSNYTLPIIIFNEEYDEQFCTKALNCGADDFLVSPINPRELHARLKAIKRRVNNDRPKQPHKSKCEKLCFYDWQLDMSSRQLYSPENQEIKLSTGEFDLLVSFVRNPQQVLSRDRLLEMTKSRAMEPFERSIDVQISRLRHKIEVDPKKPTFIKTVRCGGYLFTPRVVNSN
jgi:two-component system, OmpR family, response regulator